MMDRTGRTRELGDGCALFCWVLVLISCSVAGYLLYMRAQFPRVACVAGVACALATTLAIIFENRHFIGF